MSARLSDGLRVGGLTPLTSIDFPGQLAAVVFLQGCPWRCSYCQNPELLPAEAPAALSWDQVMGFLQRRRGLLDGVVFSGGEPTLQAGLPEAMAEVRALGFRTGLHSAGIYPRRLAEVLPLLDWLGLDIKAPAARMEGLNGVPASHGRALESLQLALTSGLALECRTSWHPSLYPLDELVELARDLAGRGVRHWALQRARIPGAEAATVPAPLLDDFGRWFASFQLR